MTVKFPKFMNLRFAPRHEIIYKGLVKSAKSNPTNRASSLNEEIMIASEFYLKYKDKVAELETKQS